MGGLFAGGIPKLRSRGESASPSAGAQGRPSPSTRTSHQPLCRDRETRPADGKHAATRWSTPRATSWRLPSAPTGWSAAQQRRLPSSSSSRPSSSRISKASHRPSLCWHNSHAPLCYCCCRTALFFLRLMFATLTLVPTDSPLRVLWDQADHLDAAGPNMLSPDSVPGISRWLLATS